MKNSLLILCKILLVISIIFWSIIVVYFSFFKFPSNENYLLLKIFLFLEPLFFTIALFGLLKKIKIIYIFSIIFVLFNAILSITDQIGIYDIVSLGLNILILISLLSILKQIFKKKIT